MPAGKKHIILIAYLLVCVTGGSQDELLTSLPIANRIINGVNANPSEFPFVVQLVVINSGMVCAGTILNAQWILTAAHCIIRAAGDFQIVAGEYDTAVVSGFEQTIRVSQIIRHPNYNNKTFANDIALVQLKQDIVYNNNVQKVKLEGSSYDKIANAVVIGWGVTQKNNGLTTILQKVTLPLFDQTMCARIYSMATQPTAILGSMICAGGAGGSGTCAGDSGGPLICSSSSGMPDVQCGIVSFAIGCAFDHVPSVFTRVSSYINFIQSVVASNSRAPT